MATEIIGSGQHNLDGMMSGDPSQGFAADFVDRDPGAGQPAGGEGLMWWWTQFGDAFSDLDRDVLEVIATPDHVVTVMTLSGTHTGEWRGHAPTGKRFSVRNVQVMAYRDGERSERWGATDELGILEQLGLAD